MPPSQRVRLEFCLPALTNGSLCKQRTFLRYDWKGASDRLATACIRSGPAHTPACSYPQFWKPRWDRLPSTGVIGASLDPERQRVFVTRKGEPPCSIELMRLSNDDMSLLTSGSRPMVQMSIVERRSADGQWMALTSRKKILHTGAHLIRAQFPEEGRHWVVGILLCSHQALPQTAPPSPTA